MKILIIKPSSLGDVVQAMPVLRLLRRRYPDALISWWVAENLTALLDDDPDLDEVIPFERSKGFSLSGILRWWGSIIRIREQRYDLVIDLQGLLRSGSFAWLAGGARSVGLDLRREGAQMFYDVAVPRPADRPHAVDWYLDVAEELGLGSASSFDWIPKRASAAASVARMNSANAKRLVALVPGARWDNKRWPAEHFADVVGGISERHADVQFAVVGGAGDSGLAREIQRNTQTSVIDLTGQTSIPEMMEWLRVSHLVVTNDTGPMHIAAALGRPVVGVFGPTDPAQTGPYGDRVTILSSDLRCAPCLKSTCHWKVNMECLHSIKARDVVAASDQWLSRGVS